jgi:DNA polymerase-1
MRSITALVDADGILYAAALKAETVCDGKQLQLLPLSRVYEDAVERLEAQVKAAGANECFVCLSDRRNFRMDLLPTYKGNRKASPRPLALDALRAKFADDSPYRVLLIEGLEADDVCGISAGRLNHAAGHTAAVIVSPDKDMLQVPGLLCTPTQDGKYHTRVITEQFADDWHMMQTLMGDVTDNYKGCPGWGATKAGELIDQFNLAGLSPAERWEEIIIRFEQKGLTADDCLTQAQVSRILRATDWDAEAKEPRLFQFPEGVEGRQLAQVA